MIDLNKIKTYKLILNKQCNYNCVYCYHGTKYDIVRGNFLSPKQFSEYLPDKGEYHITYFGGEPLLNFEYITELTDIMKQKNNKVKFSIVTNGSLLDQNKVEEINKRDIRVTISHDAVAQKITRNKEDILETKGELISKIKKLGFISTLTKYNWNYFENWEYFEKFRSKFNIPQPTIFHAGVRDLLNNIDEDLFIYKNKDYEDMLDKVYDILKNDILNQNYDSYVFRSLWKVFSRIYYENILGQGVSPCYASGIEVLTVDTNGNIYSCHNSNIINGNIRDLDNIKINTLKPVPECENCEIKDTCPKCPRVVPSKRKYYCYYSIENHKRMMKVLNEIVDMKNNGH
jgi:uncharacterized protein